MPLPIIREWVGEIRFSDAVTVKLHTKHDLSPDQVRAAVACGAHDWMTWKTHPVYGRRLLVGGSGPDGRIEAYLRPIDRRDGLWRCLTAWKVT